MTFEPGIHECRMPANCVQQFQDLAVASGVSVRALADHTTAGEDRHAELLRRIAGIEDRQAERDKTILQHIDAASVRVEGHLARLNGSVARHEKELQQIDDFHHNTAFPLIEVVQRSDKFITQARVILSILSALTLASAGALIGIAYKLIEG